MKYNRLLFCLLALQLTAIDAALLRNGKSTTKQAQLTPAEALALIVVEIETEAIKALALAQVKNKPNVEEMVQKYTQLFSIRRHDRRSLSVGTEEHLGFREMINRTTLGADLKSYTEGSVSSSLPLLEAILIMSGAPKDFQQPLFKTLRSQIRTLVKAVKSRKQLQLSTLPTRTHLTKAEELAMIIADIQGEALAAIAIARVRRDENVDENVSVMRDGYHKLVTSDAFLGQRYSFNNKTPVNELKACAEGPVEESVRNGLANILPMTVNGQPKKEVIQNLLVRIQLFVESLGT